MANKLNPKTSSNSESKQPNKTTSQVRKGQTIQRPSSKLNNDSKKK